MTTLVKWEAAKSAITAAKSVDEVKQIRDKAEALRAYAKQAGESLDVQNDIAEIKLRAERRAGEIIREMPKAEAPAGPGRGHKNPVERDDTLSAPRLSDLGISRDESSRWQKMASLPEERFEEHIARVKGKNQELTTAGVLRVARECNQEEERERPDDDGMERVITDLVNQLREVEKGLSMYQSRIPAFIAALSRVSEARKIIEECP